MVGGLFSEVLAFAPGSGTLVALLMVLLVLFLSYMHYSLGATRRLADFALSRLEVIELERAVLLYAKVARRRKEIDRERGPREPGWRARRRSRAEFQRTFGKELEELECYARDLRSTIVRLRRRPIRRCKAWIHVISARFALGGSLACYALALTALLAVWHYAEPPLWALGINVELGTLLMWQALAGRLLLANWMAVILAGAAIPMLYVVRRSQCYKQHEPVVRRLMELAAADPERLTHPHDSAEETTQENRTQENRTQEDTTQKDTTEEAPPTAPEMVEDKSWFDVLGVSPSATVADVKQAYKMLVKQNHPDRVHGMSAAFRELAEAETKKLNVAYADALTHLRGGDLTGEDAMEAA
jgi:DnaJ-domain-containing protein 1